MAIREIHFEAERIKRLDRRLRAVGVKADGHESETQAHGGSGAQSLNNDRLKYSSDMIQRVRLRSDQRHAFGLTLLPC